MLRCHLVTFGDRHWWSLGGLPWVYRRVGWCCHKGFSRYIPIQRTLRINRDTREPLNIYGFRVFFWQIRRIVQGSLLSKLVKPLSESVNWFAQLSQVLPLWRINFRICKKGFRITQILFRFGKIGFLIRELASYSFKRLSALENYLPIRSKDFPLWRISFPFV